MGNVEKKFKRKRSENHEANEKLKQLKKSEDRDQQLWQIQNNEDVLPSNNDPLIATDDRAGLPPNVAVPDDEEDGTTGAV